MWVIEIKYFEFYCKFYYFYEHLELKMILSTKYLDNLRPFTKQVKMIKENNEQSLKQMSEKSFSVWLLTEWNHIIPNIYLSTTSSWNIYVFGVHSQLPVYD